ADTTIDSTTPDSNLGGDNTMVGGEGKAMLVRFGGIDRIVGPGAKIVKARLVLAYAGRDRPTRVSVAEMLTPWGEGPRKVLNASIRRGLREMAAGGHSIREGTPRWSATWRERRAGFVSWQEPGAQGSGDSRAIPDARLEPVGDDHVAIAGLDAAVQRMADRDFDNHGFRLAFDAPVELFSSEAMDSRPRLEIDYLPGAPPSGPDLAVTLIEHSSADESTWIAHVRNVGDAVSGGFVGRWLVQERPGSSVEIDRGLKPGEEQTFAIQVQQKAMREDHRTSPIAFQIDPKGSDARSDNDFLEVQEGARPVALALDDPTDQARARDAVRLLNDVVLPQSRFSFAPDGVLERVRIQAFSQQGAANSYAPDRGAAPISIARHLVGLLGTSLDRIVTVSKVSAPDRTCGPLFGGLLHWGDTRYEGYLPPQIEVPYEPIYRPVFEAIRLEPTDLLCATAVAELNRPLDPRPQSPPYMPSTVLVRALDGAGREAPGVNLDFLQTYGDVLDDPKPTFSLTTDSNGIAILPNREGGPGLRANPFGKLDNGNASFLIKATTNGESEWAWLHAWRVQDSYSRGNAAAAIIEIPFNLPAAPLDRNVNLAKDRLVSDSTNLLPARLAALVDGNPSTDVAVGAKAGDWIEIDLGRDRPVGEVRLTFDDLSFWDRYDL
ncbi:MAG: hypothetical protein HY248_02975, partial [Fimbriimonas ginsengisoli]|nr:hypothetical protein [Fimbriimonas ginsengisoli]